MSANSTLTISVALAITALAVPIVAACSGDGDASIPDATPSPSTSIHVQTPAPTPSPPLSETPPASDRPSPTITAQPTPATLEWLDADLDVPPLPAAFASPVSDPQLQSAIQNAIPQFVGEYSVVVHNLEDGRYAAFNESRVYYGASLFKASLLLEAYRQRESGLLDFDMEVELTEEHARYDLGTLEYLELEEGGILTIEAAIRAMTIASDTPTAVLLQEIIGFAADQTLLEIGLQDTRFLNAQLPTSARDMARLFTAIAAGEGISEDSRFEMLSLLRQEWYADGVVAGAADGVPVAHKSGSFSDATHDVALVWGPAGPYIIAVMTDASYDFEPVRDVAKAVYNYFEANP